MEDERERGIPSGTEFERSEVRRVIAAQAEERLQKSVAMDQSLPEVALIKAERFGNMFLKLFVPPMRVWQRGKQPVKGGLEQPVRHGRIGVRDAMDGEPGGQSPVLFPVRRRLPEPLGEPSVSIGDPKLFGRARSRKAGK